VPDAATVRSGIVPGSAGPSVLHAPRVATAPAGSGLPPGLPPGGRRAERADQNRSMRPRPGDWVNTPGADTPIPTAPVIDGSARLARAQYQPPAEPTAAAVANGAAPAVIGRPGARSDAPARRRSRRREPELAARRFTSPHEVQPAVEAGSSSMVTDEQAFTVSTPGGSVLANEPRLDPDRGLGTG
jgi:hypothetical protein